MFSLKGYFFFFDEDLVADLTVFLMTFLAFFFALPLPLVATMMRMIAMTATPATMPMINGNGKDDPLSPPEEEEAALVCCSCEEAAGVCELLAGAEEDSSPSLPA